MIVLDEYGPVSRPGILDHSGVFEPSRFVQESGSLAGQILVYEDVRQVGLLQRSSLVHNSFSRAIGGQLHQYATGTSTRTTYGFAHTVDAIDLAQQKRGIQVHILVH